MHNDPCDYDLSRGHIGYTGWHLIWPLVHKISGTPVQYPSYWGREPFVLTKDLLKRHDDFLFAISLFKRQNSDRLSKTLFISFNVIGAVIDDVIIRIDEVHMKSGVVHKTIVDCHDELMGIIYPETSLSPLIALERHRAFARTPLGRLCQRKG